MAANSYNGLEESLSTTDLLAVERNALANERTLLAYVRTFLSFFAASISLIKFFQYRLIVFIGYVFMPVGIVILLVGFVRYFKARKIIYDVRNIKC